MRSSDPLEAIAALARKARSEQGPQVDLPLSALMEACRHEQAIAVARPPSLVWPSAVAAVIGAAVLAVSLHSLRSAAAPGGNSTAMARASQQGVEPNSPARPPLQEVASANDLSDSVDPLFAPLRMELP